MDKNKLTRITWIDYVRCIAILLVLLIHSFEQTGVSDLVSISIFASIGRLGVPLFLMISGALMLPKVLQYSISEYFQRYTKRIIQFVLLLFGYAVITNLIHILFIKREVIEYPLHFLINNNGITAKGVAVHLWYMRVITVLYILLPLLARFVRPLKSRTLCAWIALCMLPFIVSKELCSIKLLSSVFPYIGYFLLGYLISNRVDFKTKSNNIILISSLVLITSILVACIIDLRFNGADFFRLHWYSSSYTVPISSVALFILLRELFEKYSTCPPIIANLSKCAFGIYLSHYIILLGIERFVLSTCHFSLKSASLIAIYTFLTWIFSWGITAVLIRVPYLRKIVY